MGPITILDTSAFQALSAREHFFVFKHLMSNTTPVLVYEVLGDLTKQVATGASPPERVVALARKFGESGGPVNASYLILAQADLLGGTVPMTGQILPDNSVAATRMMTADLSPLTHTIMRWCAGEFSESEEEVSRLWRSHTRSLGYSGLNDLLNRNRLTLPQPSSEAAVTAVADDLLTRLPLQDVWASWAIEQFVGTREHAELAARRWSRSPRAFFSDHAPYTHHCLRCLLSLVIAVRHGFLAKNPTHMVDLQYLYYLPFCHVLVSDDRVHRLLTPQLLRDDQTFVQGKEFKASLVAVADEWEALPVEQQRRRSYALGGYPPPVDPPVLHGIWVKHIMPWTGRRPSGNTDVDLSESDMELAMAEACQVMNVSAELSEDSTE